MGWMGLVKTPMTTPPPSDEYNFTIRCEQGVQSRLIQLCIPVRVVDVTNMGKGMRGTSVYNASRFEGVWVCLARHEFDVPPIFHQFTFQ